MIICPICFGELAEWRLSKEGDDAEVDKLRIELVRLKEKMEEWIMVARGIIVREDIYYEGDDAVEASHLMQDIGNFET